MTAVTMPTDDDSPGCPLSSRARRNIRSMDVTAFQVRAALIAFGQDVSYAVAIARAAVVITRKRAMWAARADLRIAESRAQTLCANTDPFPCHAVAACGTGDCKFAHGEYAQLTVAAPAGDHVRPQANNVGEYNLEGAVMALVAHRQLHPPG